MNARRISGARGPALFDSERLWEAEPWPVSRAMDRYAPQGVYDGSAAAAMYRARYEEALEGHRFFSVGPTR